jgi:hypothetical protein
MWEGPWIVCQLPVVMSGSLIMSDELTFLKEGTKLCRDRMRVLWVQQKRPSRTRYK